MRSLVIGDIHGCYDELQQLLDVVPLTSEDRILHIGDLMDRGPYPAQVADFFRTTPNAASIRGNRDDKHVLATDGKIESSGAREVTRRQIADKDHYTDIVEYMRTLPLYLELDDALLVHAYVEPGLPLEMQDPDVLLGHEGEDTLYYGKPPWYTRYDGTKPLLVGHRDYPIPHHQQRVYFLDTRCVYGGKLTGLLLPDFVLYSVPARANHFAALRVQYPGLLSE